MLARAFCKTTLIAVLLALCLAAPAFAAKRRALVIGNDTYPNLSAGGQLKKARNDARAVSKALNGLGFTVTTGLDLTRSGLNLALDIFTRSIEPGDTIVVFFAGHGVRIKGRNYLLASDVPDMAGRSEIFLTSEAVPVDRISGLIRSRGARITMLILDACRNNPFKSTTGRAIGGTRGLARMEPAEGTFILFSAGAGQTALDRLTNSDTNPNSVFTRQLVPLLTTRGLEVGRMARLLRQKVKRLAASVNHIQTPAVYNEVTGDFFLLPEGRAPGTAVAAIPAKPARPVAPPGGAINLEALFWSSVKDSKDAAVIKTYLDKYPNGLFSALARAKLARLQKPAANPPPAATARQIWRKANIEYAIKNYPLAASLYRKAANAGDASAMYSLAKMYERGRGVAKNRTEAMQWYRKAAKNGDVNARNKLASLQPAAKSADELYKTGFAAYGRRDYPAALTALRAAAAKGNADAMHRLGYMYEDGIGVASDKTEAVRWYRKAVDRSHIKAMLKLAWLYQTGSGTAKNLPEAFRLYRRAADKGNAAAMFNVGIFYQNARGVARSLTQAALWYQSAAAKGETSAMASLASLYDRGEGVAKNPARAADLIYKSLAGGSRVFLFGLDYVDDDWSKAFRIALQKRLKAAGLLNAPADGNFGPASIRAIKKLASLPVKKSTAPAKPASLSIGQLNTLANKAYAAKDYKKAMGYYRRSAALGSDYAITNIGFMNHLGKGVPVNYPEALRWYRKAAGNGYGWAMYNLGSLYEFGRAVTKDYTQARYWYTRAAGKGEIGAIYGLGYLNDKGLGGTRDPDKAAEFIFKALQMKYRFALKQMTKKSRYWSKPFRISLQKRMKQAGYYTGPVNGEFGPRTIRAIKKLAGKT